MEEVVVEFMGPISFVLKLKEENQAQTWTSSLVAWAYTLMWRHRTFVLLTPRVFYYFSEEEAAPDGAVAEYRREKQKYEALRKQQAKKGTSREDQVTLKTKIHM